MILRGFEKRFGSYIQETVLSKENEPLVLAAKSLPRFKADWIPESDKTRATQLFTTERCKTMDDRAETPDYSAGIQNSGQSEDEENDFFK